MQARTPALAHVRADELGRSLNGIDRKGCVLIHVDVELHVGVKLGLTVGDALGEKDGVVVGVGPGSGQNVIDISQL